ncbi:MAG: extensin family protein [Pseudomonadota bacterium]
MAFRRLLSPFSGAFTLAAVLAGAAVLLVWHPDTPLSPEWNPIEPLDVRAPVTPVTMWKLDRSNMGAACHGALASSGAGFDILEDFEDSELCHIRDRMTVRAVSGVALDPLDTRCITALRTALWVEHGLKPAAQRHFGAPIARLNQIGSYNCRAIRTMAGTGTRMSTHATASAIDITGVTLADGTRSA